MYRLFNKTFIKNTFCLWVFLAMLFSFSITSFSASSKEKSCYEQIAKNLANQTPVGVSSIGGEWLVIGIARGNCSVSTNYFTDYKEKVAQVLKEKDGVLSTTKYTEYSRVILALTSIGEDVTDVLGYNLLSCLADFSKVKRQGINGPIWTLIALDSNNYAIPKCENSDNTTREKLIDYILGKELSTGGWTLVGNTPDPDVTAMAVTALSKYYNSNEEVKNAVDKGITALSDIQKSSGNFSSGGTVNCESVAQVIMCLSSLGINPDTDKRFICDGKSLIDVLLNFSVSGGFAHQRGGEYNQMATEQGFYALVAYNRLLSGKTAIFDMTDVFKSSNSDNNNTNQNGNKSTTRNDSTNSKIASSSKSNNSKENSSVGNTAKTEPNQGVEKEVNGATSKKTNTSNEEKMVGNNSKTTTSKKENSNDERVAETSESSLQNKEQQNKTGDSSQEKNGEKKQNKDSGTSVYIIIFAVIILAVAGAVFIVIKKRKQKVFKGEK